MTPEEIRAALQDRRMDIVAEKTGLHRNTITAMRNGTAVNPAHATILKLSAYLSKKPLEQANDVSEP